jgi:DNA helicase II / ATP-dependent DNA helicase PcrA
MKINFDYHFNELNSSQRECVSHIDGPLLVLAGPGTGKTQVLGLRVANILLKTDVSPENILCITFSEAGVKAMQERLYDLIGSDAYKVNVYTFHKLGYEIFKYYINDFSEDVPKLADSNDVNDIINDLLRSIDPKDSFLNSERNFDTLIQKCQHLFREMKVQDWSPDFIESSINEFLEGIEENPDYLYKVRKNGSYLNENKINTAKQKLQILKDASQFFSKYSKDLLDAGFIEYPDMINYAIKSLHDKKEIIDVYQERFQYVLIDEFQDSNKQQLELIYTLFSYWDSPNIFIVGDDDQAIYEFQGARLENIKDFYMRYKKDIQVFCLTDNYRSHHSILEASNNLIKNNKLRLTVQLSDLNLNKELITHRSFENGHTKCLIFEDENNSIYYVYNEIIKLISNGTSLNEIAILGRRKNDLVLIEEVLSFYNIPVCNLSTTSNLFSIPFIQNFFVILEYILSSKEDIIGNDYLLGHILYFPYWNISDEGYVKLIKSYQLYRAENSSGLWVEFLSTREFEVPEEIRNLFSFISSCSKKLDFTPPDILINEIFKGMDIEGYLSEQDDFDSNLFLLYELKNLLWDLMESYSKLGSRAILVKYIERSKNETITPVPSLTNNGVQLMTIHGSKGLQFEHIYLMNSDIESWNKKGASYRHFMFPDTLVQFGQETDTVESLRRLFFVALTRTKISFTTIVNLQNSGPVEFISEAGIDARKIDSVANDLIQKFFGPMNGLDRSFSNRTHLIVESYVENFQGGVTDYISYLKCPVAFFYTKILRLGDRRSLPLLIGNVVHDAAFKWLKYWDSSEFLDKSGISILVSNEISRIPFLDDFDRFKIKDFGIQYLKFVDDNFIKAEIENVLLEKAYQTNDIFGVPMKARLDRIDLLKDGTVRIVEYKTGNKDVGGMTAQNWGKHRFQIQCYTLLLEKILEKEITEYQIIYFDNEKDHLNIYNKSLPNIERAIVLEMLESAYAGIKSRDFSSGCNKPDCKWCEYEKFTGFLKN